MAGAEEDRKKSDDSEHHFWRTIGRVAAVASLIALGLSLAAVLIENDFVLGDESACIFSNLGGEFPIAYTETQVCPSGAVLTITAPNGYGESAISGKVSAATADDGVTVELRNPNPTISNLVIEPSEEPGCFGQYIEAAGYEAYSMIDTAEIVRFVDDGRTKTFIGFEDCEPGSLSTPGTGKQIVIQYLDAQLPSNS